jgi:hypothetical protein
MDTEIQTQLQRQDRWVSWAVAGLFVIALLLGWAVKAAAEARAVSTEVDGVRLRYPAGWVRVSADPPVLLQVEDWVGPARATLIVQRRPLPPGDKPLAAIQQTLALERARTWTAYRVLDIISSALIEGRPGMRATFAYVETNPNPFLQTMPVVMHGEDDIVPVGNEAYIVTLTAPEEKFVSAQAHLRTLLLSLPR